QIADYQEQINEATVRASVSGVVTRINVKEGATFTGGVIASIEAVDQFVVEAQIEEYDIADIATGMKVLIKTDATRDAELEGEVTYIAPRATNSGSSAGGFNSLISGVDTSSFSSGSGSATYLVKIAISESNERLRLGMNAKVSILTEERVDAWSVPYDAVYTREDGSTYLEKVTGKDEDGNILTEEMNVELGIQGTYYVEVISSEIQEGIQILIPDAQGNSSIQELLNMMGADAGI
ncbi:MAG: HlyD family efflux transporter periplasmic adaptor subunit, partial [Agathobacter sp.]|nr:HlyD family efflux transporter periplasmic adaptor subunit [Agathobacter sp.]